MGDISGLFKILSFQRRLESSHLDIAPFPLLAVVIDRACVSEALDSSLRWNDILIPNSRYVWNIWLYSQRLIDNDYC